MIPANISIILLTIGLILIVHVFILVIVVKYASNKVSFWVLFIKSSNPVPVIWDGRRRLHRAEVLKENEYLYPTG